MPQIRVWSFLTSRQKACWISRDFHHIVPSLIELDCWCNKWKIHLTYLCMSGQSFWDKSGVLDCQIGVWVHSQTLSFFTKWLCVFQHTDLKKHFQNICLYSISLIGGNVKELDNHRWGDLDLCLFHCSVIFHEKQQPLHQHNS